MNKLIFSILYNLFFPWLDAMAKASYQEYSQTQLYEFLHKTGGSRLAFEKWYLDQDTNANSTISALKKHWFRIMFMPWTFIIHPDFIHSLRFQKGQQ